MEKPTVLSTDSIPQKEIEIRRRVGAFCDILKGHILQPQMLKAVASFFEDKTLLSILDLGNLLSQNGLNNIDVRTALLNEDLFLSDSDSECYNDPLVKDNPMELLELKLPQDSNSGLKSEQLDFISDSQIRKNGTKCKQKKHKQFKNRKPVPIQVPEKETKQKKKRKDHRKPVLISEEPLNVGGEDRTVISSCVVQRSGQTLSSLVPDPIKISEGFKAKFRCPQCPSTNSRRDNFVTHYKEKHLSNGKLQCPHCPKAFQYTRDLKRHACLEQPNRDYSCRFCQKKFSSSKALNEHEKRRCKLRHDGNV